MANKNEQFILINQLVKLVKEYEAALNKVQLASLAESETRAAMEAHQKNYTNACAILLNKQQLAEKIKKEINSLLEQM